MAVVSHSTVSHVGLTGVVSNLRSGTGVPPNGDGSNGDYYFRTDGALLVTAVYHKVAGVWVGLAIA